MPPAGVGASQRGSAAAAAGEALNELELSPPVYLVHGGEHVDRVEGQMGTLQHWMRIVRAATEHALGALYTACMVVSNALAAGYAY